MDPPTLGVFIYTRMECWYFVSWDVINLGVATIFNYSVHAFIRIIRQIAEGQVQQELMSALEETSG